MASIVVDAIAERIQNELDQNFFVETDQINQMVEEVLNAIPLGRWFPADVVT